MAPLKTLGRRLLSAVLVLLGVTLLTFLLLDHLPGNAAEQMMSGEGGAQRLAQLEERLHLDRPVWERYLEWLRQVSSGDLGESLVSGQPVWRLLEDRIGVSAELIALALVISVGAAIPVALLAAHRPGGWIDRSVRAIGLLGLSAPSYVLALLLVWIFSVELRLLPSMGYRPLSAGLQGHFDSLLLPSISIAVPLACFYASFLRNDLVQQMRSEDYVTTALAKGLSRWSTLTRHAFRNSLFGFLSVMGLHIGALIGGTVVVEQVFALPGIGQLLLQGISLRDVAVVQAIVLLSAVATVAISMLLDLLYAAIDPRIRYQGAG